MQNTNAKTRTMSYNALIQVFIDIIIVNISMLLALYIAGNDPFDVGFKLMSVYQLIFTAIYIFMFLVFGLYSILWRFAGLYDLVKASIATVFASSMACLTFVLIDQYVGEQHKISILPYFIALWMCIFIFKLLTFFAYKCKPIFRITRFRSNNNAKRVMIIGAGEAGSLVINSMLYQKKVNKTYIPVVAIDDQPKKKGTKINGVMVYGDRHAIIKAVEKFNIDEIILTIPSSSKEEAKKILEICAQTSCKLRTLPDIYSLITEDINSISVNTVRDVNITDLLGRQEISLKSTENYSYIKGKTVLVTGGGGTIGSELCRQITAHGVKKLLLLDIYENTTYDLQQELIKKHGTELDLTVIIASVQDESIIDDVFSTYRPDVVFHAAAHKHVPLMEDCPKEAIKNNVLGTLNIARAASKYGAAEFVLISTDKAVNPTNIMGATKRLAEMIVQNYNTNSKTKFTAVRFGNVLGSNGSVIPIFLKQIEEGGPITVTHPNITRFFMTVNEAVQLVIQSGAITNGGEIFILDMGSPVKIVDLAKNLITLSGKDLEISYTGLRPGEKLYEELMMQEEGLISTKYKKIFVANPVELDDTSFIFEIGCLKEKLESGDEDPKAILKKLVCTYVSPEEAPVLLTQDRK